MGGLRAARPALRQPPADSLSTWQRAEQVPHLPRGHCVPCLRPSVSPLTANNSVRQEGPPHWPRGARGAWLGHASHVCILCVSLGSAAAAACQGRCQSSAWLARPRDSGSFGPEPTSPSLETVRPGPCRARVPRENRNEKPGPGGREGRRVCRAVNPLCSIHTGRHGTPRVSPNPPTWHASSEPKAERWTLGDNDVSTQVHQL